MEKAMYPSPYIRITQKDHVGTHADSWAFDEAGSDGGIDFLNASFTGTIKKIYTADANEVWLESNEQVKFADGTIDYMTMMFAHDNNVSDLWVGKVIKQGEKIYDEGTKGNATGNHCHIECAKGKFTGSGWHQDNAGYWSINNGKKVDECLWIDDSYHVLDTAGYNFRNVKDAEPKKLGTPVARNENIEQVRIFDESIQVNARNNPNGDILGYMNTGIYNLLERKLDGNYEWFRVENGLWFAYSTDWSELLPKKEEPKPVVDEDKVKIEELENKIQELEEQIANDNEVIAVLQEQLENQPKEIFTCSRTDNYQIKLYESEKLFIQ